MTVKTLREAAEEYREFPEEIVIALKQARKLVFVHSHHNLDAVLMGMNLLSRGISAQTYRKSLIRVKLDKPVAAGMHIWFGVAGVKGVANAYVHAVEGTTALIGSMGSFLEVKGHVHGR